jgi:hypothetical protein
VVTETVNVKNNHELKPTRKTETDLFGAPEVIETSVCSR